MCRWFRLRAADRRYGVGMERLWWWGSFLAGAGLALAWWVTGYLRWCERRGDVTAGVE